MQKNGGFFLLLILIVISLALGSFTLAETYTCTKKICDSEDNCKCPEGSKTDVVPITNPDEIEDACACIIGTSWVDEANENFKCCGDDNGGTDSSDCGLISNGFLCSINKDWDSSSWESSDEDAKIVFAGCQNMEYMSINEEWFVCDNFSKGSILGNEIICNGVKEQGSIIECCGSKSCVTSGDGLRLSTGEQVKSYSTEGISSNFASIENNAQDINPKSDNTIVRKITGFFSAITGRASSPESAKSLFGSETIIQTINQVDSSSLNSVCGNKICEPNEDMNSCAIDCPITIYCKSNGKFGTNLDDSEESCRGAGFTWTRTMCCSEDDDPKEYYNDKGGIGGCWNNKTILNSKFIDEQKSLFVSDGLIHGCALEKELYIKEDLNYMGLIDNKAVIAQSDDVHLFRQELGNNHDYCQKVGIYYCSYNETWQALTLDSSSNTIKFALESNVPQFGGCCSEMQCWNGSKCINNQASESKAQPYTFSNRNFRCVNGNWKQAVVKQDLQGREGYCPENNQCLVNINGNPQDNGNPTKNPQCINNSQFMKDNYCNNGKWESRTMIIALQMLDNANNEFILFCDNKEKTLNYVTYLGSKAQHLENNANNICVMDINGKILIGTSLNIANNKQKEILKDLFVIECSTSTLQNNDGFYHDCDNTKRLWYNKRLDSVIYVKSKQEINQLNIKELLILYHTFLENPKNETLEKIQAQVDNADFEVDSSYEIAFGKFGRLYLRSNEGKKITGFIEGPEVGIVNALLRYENYNVNLCGLASKIAHDDVSGILCLKEGNRHYLLLQGSQFAGSQTTIFSPEMVWTDLTSKTR